MGLIEEISRTLIDRIADQLLLRLMRDPYVENLWELISTTMKVTPRDLMEIVLRAEKGKPLGRPFGTVYHFSPWQELLFNPVHLVRLPTVDEKSVETKVTLGPKAKRPLELAIPIIISGMSYGGAISKQARFALAKAATAAGTAINTGEGAYIPEERELAAKYIYQYHRGQWPHGNKKEFYTMADMVEIQLGQGAQASAPQTTKADKIDEEFRQIFGLKEGEDAVIASRLPGLKSGEDLKRLVARLKEETGGVPISYKFAASHYLEEEIELALAAGVDVIVIDGAEAGTHAGQPLIADSFGLPTMHALVRTADYLEEKGVRDQVSLIAAGGLLSPDHFLKAMALGADAVYIGTAAVMAMIHTQMVETSPFEPPTQLVLYSGRLKDKLDIDRAAQSLTNYLNSCVAEMVLGTVALGKKALSEVDRRDLCALTPTVAEITGVELGYRRKEAARFPMGEQPARVGEEAQVTH
ncbi:MAG TPA: FMN-binding glutamate synthase family protein [Firmicutes bacterium]|nr:FMN-binding glutamate synthase family protein [Bacillota bacterium]